MQELFDREKQIWSLRNVATPLVEIPSRACTVSPFPLNNTESPPLDPPETDFLGGRSFRGHIKYRTKEEPETHATHVGVPPWTTLGHPSLHNKPQKLLASRN